MGANPSISNVGNTLTSQAIVFDKSIWPNLKGETNAYFKCVTKVIQPLGSGVNRHFFQYATLNGNLTPSQDGSVGSPIDVPQITSAAQVSEWADYTNFSAMTAAAAIDDLVDNSATEMGYRAGQSLSGLYQVVADSAIAVDSNVNASGLLSTPFLASFNTLQTLKGELSSINVAPHSEGEYCGVISPNVANDIFTAVTTTTSLGISQYYAHTDKGQEKFEKMAGSYQTMPLRFPGTGIVFYQTPFVTKTPNFSASLTAYRTYVFGQQAMVGVWLEVPGDTDLNGGDWRTIDCRVTTNAPSSAFDPTGTIGAWASYRFHQTATLPPARGINTQRIRILDSVPAIQ